MLFGHWCRDPKKPWTCWPFARVGGIGATPGGGLFPFSNAASTTPPSPAPTPVPSPTPGPTPPVNTGRDFLTPVPFSILATTILPISGGGNALSVAVPGAPPGTILLIMDSLNYTPVVFSNKTDVTIQAAGGQTPTITAVPGNNQHCITFGVGNQGIALRGLTFIGSGNAGPPGPPGQAQQGLINYNNTAGGLRRVIIEDCTFIEPDPTVSQGAPGIWLRGTVGAPNQTNIWVHRCTFINNGMSLTATDPSGFGVCTIGGFSSVFVQNCWVRRTTAVLARNQSPMRGIVVKGSGIVIEDVLCDDIGTGGQCENFNVPQGPSFGALSGTVSLRNCIAFNPRIGYAVNDAGSTLIVTNCVVENEVAATFTAVFLNLIGNLTYVNSISSSGGGGNAFTTNPNGAPIIENHNDIFDWGTIGRPLDPTDITVDPLFEGPGTGDFVATAPACQTAANDGGPLGVRYPGGEKIIYVNP